jgi:NuA3 HAT complex component NTO1
VILKKKKKKTHFLTLCSSDKKNVFTEGLSKLGERVRNRFYTTALTFVNDLSQVFSAGISNEPPVKSEVVEADKTSPSKKHPIDMKERKRLAKRIIKAVQPLLENAVQVEADISGQPAEAALKELHRLIEACFQTPSDSVGLESGSLGEAGADVEMADAGQDGAQSLDVKASEHHHESHDPNQDIDVEMDDIDAPHGEEYDAVIVDDGTSKDTNTINTAALAEVNGNISMKYNHINGVKGESVSPTTNGHVMTENEQPGPPTPPFSNGDVFSEQGAKVLTDGGIPRFLKDFQIDGTHITDPEAVAASDDLSDMDDDELNGLRTSLNEPDGEVVATGGRASPVKTKKGKAKKKKAGSKVR